MIFCKELNKGFENRTEMFKAIIANKANISALKKSAVKFTDGLCHVINEGEVASGVVKSNDYVEGNMTEIKVRVVMNTTNVYDSHGDVHIDGLWKRTLQHSDTKLHLQEHKRDFDKVISSTAKAFVRKMDLSKLSENLEGSTQALIFDSVVTMSRNPLMFEQYKNGWVNNHSVGMQYVDFVVCINSEEKWAEEYKKNFDKYYPLIANKEDVDENGYFWAILEAKLLEGSAVLFGSNWVTPTLENNMKSDSSPSFENNEPPHGTQRKERQKALNELLKTFKN